ncbi:hypothetical protein [Pseudomonas sp. 5P_3.1_Bac2]|uniref:hypothetical protein n=1 Tax=Pseudomonas sp. 5P_3.1_Bac2 TaxID=2971617 RepID=UPI0021C87643|nr:hypothetical protein [Pseudomonas sp. 5P_3.1_Bac2]MCU1719635.1 hypothetical protein [Pseudomonas sp. 5P_3.1_Bac2]
MRELNPIPLILTAVASVCATVAVLGFYGYLHIAKPEDALLLADFTMLKTVEGEDYKVSIEPASQVAQCIDNVLVLFDTEQRGLTGVLVNNKKRAVRCVMPQPAGEHSAQEPGAAGQAVPAQ